MTWKDLQIATLQKLFAISGNTLVNDDTTNTYLSSMPQAANEGLQLLATAGRFIKKQFIITQGGEAPEDGVYRALSVGVNRYDLNKLVEDFYTLNENGVFLQGGSSYGKTGWFMEGDSILVLEAATEGVFTIWYNAYPPNLTKDTEAGYELPIHREVETALPLYIASQLYKDDDLSIAVQYRNEFEIARGEMIAASQKCVPGVDRVENTTGWW